MQPIPVEGKTMKSEHNIIKNADGSVIVVALLVLLLMSIIGLSATGTSVNESFIIRNVGIYRQNLNLVEAAVLEVTQDALFLVSDPAAELAVDSPIRADYMVSETTWNASGKNDDWYDTASLGRVLDGAPNVFPQYRVPRFINDTTLINGVRAEAGDPLRVALVGWLPAAGGSIKLYASQSIRLEGRVMAEYASEDYGVTRLEMGIEREFK